MGGVDTPTSGEVCISGTDISKLDETKLAIFRRRQIGLIYQFYNLIPILNVEENMTLPILLDGKKPDKKLLKDLVEKLGLSERVGHLPSQLSGGQQQRVSIGRALMNHPSLLLADEPTDKYGEIHMRKILGKRLTKGMVIVLGASILAGSTGCGNTMTSEKTQIGAEESSSDAASAQSTEVSDTQTVTEKISDNGKPITDFDEFVNGEWKKQKEQADNGSDAIWWDEQRQVDDRVRDILDNTDIETIEKSDGLYKAISIYRHILDTQDYDQRISSAKKHLKPIEDIHSLEDIYQLYRSEEYMMYSEAFKFTISPDGNGYNAVWFRPGSMTDDIEFRQGLIAEDSADNTAREQFLKMMENLGYSETRTIEILDNAAKIGKMVDDYWNEQSKVSYYEQKDLDEEGVLVPVIEILGELNSLGKHKNFIAKENCCQLLNSIYREENVAAIRDHLLFAAISRLLIVYGKDMIKAAYGTEYNEVAFSTMTKYASDVLNREYNSRYLKDFDQEQAQDIIEEVKEGYRGIISDSEWLSVHGKELAKHKILTMRVSLGENEIQNNLDDLELTGDIVDDYVALRISNDRFGRSQVNKEDDKRPIFGVNLFEVNARFIYELNALYVTGGMLSSPYCSQKASYEEMLGYFGETVAHEYGHSYDPKGINYDWRGWWENWMKEDEAAAYQKKQQSIVDFFDGKEVEYGRKIDGELIRNETYADLMAMECCLRILEKKENPDYDTFFRSFAMRKAFYTTEQDIDYIMSDDHLISKERVNFVLGQFDKFYEIYDIDESSPYYVPKEKRLHVF